MWTFIKYTMGFILIFIIYVIFSGIYDGDITGKTTISNIGTQVTNQAKDIVNNTEKK